MVNRALEEKFDVCTINNIIAMYTFTMQVCIKLIIGEYNKMQLTFQSTYLLSMQLVLMHYKDSCGYHHASY